MSSKKIFASFVKRYPHKTDRIYFAKRTLRGATYSPELEPLGQPAELHHYIPTEIAVAIYNAGWQDAKRTLTSKLADGLAAALASALAGDDDQQQEPNEGTQGSD